jgi:uncharacterized protein RhaS with RHS repeats
LSDPAGALTDTYQYDAFGNELGRTGVTENNYLFAGEQFDESLHHYYLRARYYDQSVGPDSISSMFRTSPRISLKMV